MKFTIGRIASALGINAETIRHYREYGLLRPAVEENGYFSYHVNDVLQILLTKEFRSQEQTLGAIKSTFEQRTLSDYCMDLDAREEQLLKELDLLQLALFRLRETRVYASCGIRILNGVEEFDGPATWAVSALDARGLVTGSGLSGWVEHFPFTYVSATIPLDALETQTGTAPYPVAIGAGALEKYVHRFALPHEKNSFFQPGGHFIRTCITTDDVFSISPAHIAPLIDYAREHHYKFVSCTGGRLLFVEHMAQKPLYYVLIWVRVDPA